MDGEESALFDEEAFLPTGSSSEDDYEDGPSSSDEDTYDSDKKTISSKTVPLPLPSGPVLDDKTKDVNSQVKVAENPTSPEANQNHNTKVADSGLTNTASSSQLDGTQVPSTSVNAVDLLPPRKPVKKLRGQPPPFAFPKKPLNPVTVKYSKECEICGKTVSYTHYKTHIIYHGKERPYKCDICNRAFASKTHLQRHGFLHRTKSKITKKVRYCKYCQWGFFRKDLLYQHESLHRKSKEFLCSFSHCGMSFFSQATLDDHYPMHSDPAPFKCTMCSKGFKYRNYLSEHVRRVHKISFEEYLDSISTLDTVLTATFAGAYVLPSTQEPQKGVEPEEIPQELNNSLEAEKSPTSTDVGKSLSSTETEKQDHPSNELEDDEVDLKMEVESPECSDKDCEDMEDSTPFIKNALSSSSEETENGAEKEPLTRRTSKRPVRSCRKIKASVIEENGELSSNSEDEAANNSKKGNKLTQLVDRRRNRKQRSGKQSKLLTKSTETKSSATKDKSKKTSTVSDSNSKKCEYCGKITLNSKAYYAHKRNVHEKKDSDAQRIECDICQKMVVKKRLKEHIRLAHEKRFQHHCNLCGSMFSTSQGLKRHIIRTHNNNPRETTLPKRIIHCRICRWGFFRRDLLDWHLKMHDNSEKIPCTESSCEFTFFSTEHLEDHLEMHKDPKPFKCAKCSNGYKAKINLNDHMKLEHNLTLGSYLDTIATDDTVLNATLNVVTSSSLLPKTSDTSYSVEDHSQSEQRSVPATSSNIES